MTELTEFLEARFSEDQKAAEDRDFGAPIHETGCYYYNHEISPQEWTADCCDCSDEAKARGLAEVAAKRAILKTWAPHETYDGIELMKVLALPYADHPDYRPDYRPECAL